jgi:hypothetical protein
MPDPKPKFARVNPRNPEAWARCDRCGFWFQSKDLAFQYEWAGVHLYNTGALVCTTGNRCYDKPFEQLRTIILPPDPPPILNARTEYFAYDEQTVRILEYNALQNPPWGAGPQTIRALQNGQTERLLEFSLSTQGILGRITDLTQFTGSLAGSEILELATTSGTPNTPVDGRLTSLPGFGGTPTGLEVMELIATGRGNSTDTIENADYIPLDGQITSLQQFLIFLAGTEVMEMVTPNNSQTGQNYQVTTAILAAFFSSYPFINPTQVAQGSTYNVKTTDTRILIKSGIAAVTSIVFPLAATMFAPYPVLVKDWIGDAFANNINITFSGGELCDGESEVQLTDNYAWVTLNPNPGGGGWYLST